MGWKSDIRDPECSLCPLHQGAQHVCLMGSGSRRAKVMIVGEAPGAREDDQHAAFVGPAGQLLSKLLEECAGLSRDELYITNVAKCRPPSNRTPERAEAKICASTYLTKEIAAVAPDYIILLGNTALQGVSGKSGITKHRGHPLQHRNSVLLPTFHPAAALRNPKYLPDLESDFARFGRTIRGENSKVEDTKTKLIRTESHLRGLVQALAEQEVVAFDIETNGLYEEADGAKIVTIGFSWARGHAVVVPIYHASEPWGGDPRAVLAALKPAMERADLQLVAHNGKFDCRWMAAAGIFVNQAWDTMLAAHLLDENRPKGLESLATSLLGRDPWKDQQARTSAYETNLKRLARYNGRDCDITLQLYQVLEAQLQESPRLSRIFHRLMMPASNVLTKVERTGLPLNMEQVTRELATTENNITRADHELRGFVPEHKREAFNPNSHQQVAQWLFVDLGLPIMEQTGKGAPSSKESVLLRLQRKHDGPRLLLEMRALTKRAQFLRSWVENADTRGRLHTHYKLYGTVTGRLSSEGPNLQQVPRERGMRSCFAAPVGWKFVEADFSQAELRIAAMVANEKNMLRIFHTGRDPHLETAAAMLKKPASFVTKSDKTGKTEYRKKAKGVNFGFLFGMGEDHFADYAESNYDFSPTQQEAHEWREAFFGSYPAFRSWHDRQRRLALRYGQVNSPIGRVRHLPDVHSSDKRVAADAQRQAINSPVQSFASDLMLVSMVLLDGRLDPRSAHIVGTVHDALLFLVRDAYVADAVPLVKRTMEKSSVKAMKKWFDCEVTVPIEAEVKVGQAWGLGEVVA